MNKKVMHDLAVTGAEVKLREAQANVMMLQHFLNELKNQKPEKPKRKMSAARRKAMLANLKKGREALAAKRNGGS